SASDCGASAVAGAPDLALALSCRIRAGTGTGGMPATIRDVARLAGVSEATVSRALRDLRHVAPETADAVRAAADRLGFVLTRTALLAGQASAHVVIGFGLDDAEQGVVRAVLDPLVTVGGAFDGVRGIGIPEAEVARLAVGHLLDLGHRRIGHVGGDGEPGL